MILMNDLVSDTMGLKRILSDIVIWDIVSYLVLNNFLIHSLREDFSCLSHHFLYSTRAKVSVTSYLFETKKGQWKLSTPFVFK